MCCADQNGVNIGSSDLALSMAHSTNSLQFHLVDNEDKTVFYGDRTN